MKNKSLVILFVALLLVVAYSLGRISPQTVGATNVTPQDAITQLQQRVNVLENKVAAIEYRHKEEDKPRREPREPRD